jgi:uncharacterized protein YhfF
VAFTMISPTSKQLWLVEPGVMTLVPPEDRDNAKCHAAMGEVSEVFFKRIDATHERSEGKFT